MSNIVPLSMLADIGLGFKSLQNDFFYISGETIKTYGIEKSFLEPIYKLADFDAGTYVQSIKPGRWVFCCDQAESELKGTGALKYIRASAERAASEKKQSSGRVLTIRDVLEKQSGRFWYSPKAQRVASKIWMRKGMGTLLAPILSKIAIVVDQRCNYIKPKSGVTDAELAALLSSSVFAYSVEINGSTSMGAGVLEAPTTKLREYPVPNIVNWSKADRSTLANLGQAVFDKSTPHDWRGDEKPAKELRQLDEHLLHLMNPLVTPEKLYADMCGAVHSRLRMAESRTTNRQKRHTDSLAGLANEIAKKLRELIEIKPFPEGFTASGSVTDSVDLRDCTVTQIESHPMMGQTELIITQDGSTQTLKLPDAAAEIFIRALLLGRRQFVYPVNTGDANKTNTLGIAWLRTIENKLTKAVQESAAGSGYEDTLSAMVLRSLGISVQSFLPVLPRKLSF